MFPTDRDVLLDGELLRKLGLNKERMIKKDTLWFWQLLFPIANPAENEIQHDPRLPYYEEVGEFSNLYLVMVKNRGGSRTHA